MVINTIILPECFRFTFIFRCTEKIPANIKKKRNAHSNFSIHSLPSQSVQGNAQVILNRLPELSISHGGFVDFERSNVDLYNATQNSEDSVCLCTLHILERKYIRMLKLSMIPSEAANHSVWHSSPCP